MEAKFYILSKLHKHASAVLQETGSTLTIQKIKTLEKVNEFSTMTETLIVPDENYPERTESKDDLTKVFSDVELTADYWKVYEYMTGYRRRAVAENSEC